MKLRSSASSLICVAAAAAVGLGACGSSSNSSSSSSGAPSTPAATTSTPATTTPTPTAARAGSTLSLQAEPTGQLLFVEKSLATKAGKVTLDFTNMSSVPHDVVIARGSTVVGSSSIIMGSSTTLAVTLAKGTYVFYCSVDGHRAAGMQGTLTVS